MESVSFFKTLINKSECPSNLHSNFLFILYNLIISSVLMGVNSEDQKNLSSLIFLFLTGAVLIQEWKKAGEGKAGWVAWGQSSSGLQCGWLKNNHF